MKKMCMCNMDVAEGELFISVAMSYAVLHATVVAF